MLQKKRALRRRSLGVLSCLVACGIAFAGTQPAAPTILLVRDSNVFPYHTQLYEYDLGGQVVSQREIPTHGADTRDIVQLWGEELGFYQGTFTPLIRVFTDQSWASYEIPGLSVVNNGSYGGIAYSDGKLYVGDMFTYNGGEPRGIVRIDLASGAYQRFLENNDYIDVSIGLDGMLYGLRDYYGRLDVIDPGSMTVAKALFLGHTSSSRAVTADRDGTIFMASWDGYVAKYTGSGALASSLELGSPLYDLDIERDGRLVSSDYDGRIYLTDVGLTGAVAFDPPTPSLDGGFVAFMRSTPTDLTTLRETRRMRLTWTSGEQLIDIYREGLLIHRGNNDGGYLDSLPAAAMCKSLRYNVCNSGTSECAKPVQLSGTRRCWGVSR